MNKKIASLLLFLTLGMSMPCTVIANDDAQPAQPAEKSIIEPLLVGALIGAATVYVDRELIAPYFRIASDLTIKDEIRGVNAAMGLGYWIFSWCTLSTIRNSMFKNKFDSKRAENFDWLAWAGLHLYLAKK